MASLTHGAPRTRSTINTFTEYGAQELADRIVAYWAQHGYGVEARVVREPKLWGAAILVVTDLVDGLPAGKQSRSQRALGKAAVSAREESAA